MTSLTGNICLGLAALISIALLSPLFQHRISHSNDQGASGYLLIIVFFLSFLFLGLMSMAYMAINKQGGFNWVSTSGGLRFMILAIGLISAVIISGIGIITRFMPFSSSDRLQSFMQFVPLVIYIVTIGTGLILNNASLREIVPVPVYKWLSYLVNGLCFLGIIIFGIKALLTPSLSAAEATRQYESSPSIMASRLEEFETSDPKNDMVRLMEFAGALYPAEVREKASAKIKTNPDWQIDLVDKLEEGFILECFNFLQGNDVEDKSLFLQPVLKGVKDMAVRLRTTIQSTLPSEFNRNMFSDEVNRTLRTVERFEGMGVDYVPAIREVRAALDEPVAGKVYKFDAGTVLDAWIEKH